MHLPHLQLEQCGIHHFLSTKKKEQAAIKLQICRTELSCCCYPTAQLTSVASCPQSRQPCSGAPRWGTGVRCKCCAPDAGRRAATAATVTKGTWCETCNMHICISIHFSVNGLHMAVSLNMSTSQRIPNIMQN